jgi:hypothetical protein
MEEGDSEEVKVDARKKELSVLHLQTSLVKLNELKYCR